MKFQLEIQHESLQRVRLLLNGQQVCDMPIVSIWNHDINVHNQECVEIWFWPWHIKPLLRIDGHLLDYSLAKVDQYSHMLSFSITKNFFDLYFSDLIHSRIHTLFQDNNIDDELYDAMVGYGDRHTDLIDSIKNQIR